MIKAKQCDEDDDDSDKQSWGKWIDSGKKSGTSSADRSKGWSQKDDHQSTWSYSQRPGQIWNWKLGKYIWAASAWGAKAATTSKPSKRTNHQH